MDFRKEALAINDFLVSFRHDLHRHPEISMQEFRTTDAIADVLDSWGVHYIRFNPTGLMVDVKGSGDGPTILLRADIDALPIQETTGLDYASVIPNVMHACGHDTHAAMLLGGLRLVLDHKEELKGNVRFVFQPGEEDGEGAETILKQGAADGVSMCFGMHCAPDHPVGAFGCYEGDALAACAEFTITVNGKAAHGATPQFACDAITASGEIISTLQSIVSRRLDPLKPAVVSIGMINGGTAFNIIPDKCSLTGTCRYFDSSLDEKLPALMSEISSSVAAAYGCTASVDFSVHTHAVHNDKKVTNIAWNSVKKVIDDPSLTMDFPQIMAGDDFGIYGKYAPSAYFFLGAGGNGPGHNGCFRVDDDILHTGAAMHAQFAFDAIDALLL